MGSPKKSVKLVPLQSELVEQLYSIAASMGIPFKTLLNNLVEKGIRIAMINNGSLDEVEREYYVQKTFSRLGFQMIPLPLLTTIVEEMSEDMYKQVLAHAKENGRQIGALLSLETSMTDAEKVRHLLKALFPEATQITVSQQGKGLKIALIIHGRSRRLIEMPLAILKGALASLGYDELKTELNPGLVLADYRKIT